DLGVAPDLIRAPDRVPLRRGEGRTAECGRRGAFSGSRGDRSDRDGATPGLNRRLAPDPPLATCFPGHTDLEPREARLIALLAAVTLAMAPPLLSVQAKDPEDVLLTYLSDLEKAIKNTNAKNLQDRTKLEAAAKLAFDRELASSVPTVPKPVWEYLSKHLDNLRRGDKKFPEESWKTERTSWITACKNVFSREIARAKEPESATTTEQLFESLFDAVREIDKMFPLERDFRMDGINSARLIYTQALVKATPTTKDAKLLYTERLARIDKTFPVTSDKEKDS